MKQYDLKQMYGSTPERFKRRVAFALHGMEEQAMKRRFRIRTVLIAAAILVLLMAAAYAAFSSQVAEFFGRSYGSDMQNWLEKGDVAVPNQSFTLDEVTFTLEEVVYRDNALYGVGTIRPAEGSSVVIIPEDDSPDEPYGYDIHGAGGRPEEAPPDAPTTADVAKEKGGRLLKTFTRPEQIGVDGGEMLSPGTVGYASVPQRDGSIRFSFELSDAYAIQTGETYTIQMLAFMFEINTEGKQLEGTRRREDWTVEIQPTPISAAERQEPSDPLPLTTDAAFALPMPEVIILEAYAQTGTLPIYRATERDFRVGLRPEWFNQSGIASHSEWQIVFQDEAILQLAPEAIFYGENNEVFDASNDTESEADDTPLGALSDAISGLASWAMHGWPGDNTVYQLEKTELTEITLDEAQETLETLLEQLGITGYICDYALDMSLERIMTLGNDMNAMITSGEFFTNIPQYDFNQATTADEGFFLSYHKPGDRYDQGNGDIFSAYAFVTKRGVVHAAIRDMYIPGEIYNTPETLVNPEAILERLPKEMAASRYPREITSISSIQLTYAPMRALNKADGMVLSPIWLVIYQDAEAVESGYNCWAEFDAVDGKLLNAIFK